MIKKKALKWECLIFPILYSWFRIGYKVEKKHKHKQKLNEQSDTVVTWWLLWKITDST